MHASADYCSRPKALRVPRVFDARLVGDPEVAATLGQNGRVQVEVEFDVDHFASRFARTIASEIPNEP